MCIYIYVYIYMYVNIYTHIYIHINYEIHRNCKCISDFRNLGSQISKKGARAITV